tara:strand:- start:100 stop:717 length:618 start_codon:yes stop_codon:yes gene_type:complete
LAIVSRRIAKPFPGKSEVVLSRVTKFRDLVIKAGAKARAAKFIGGSLNGSIQLTTIYENMTEATKSFEAYSKDPEMISLMKEREDNPAATLVGPEIYAGVFGSPSPDHNVLMLREYEMDRKSMPKAIELLSKVDKIVQKEDSKMLALRPIIADKMDTLFIVYYYSSIASMGDIIDRVGMSEEFQKLVNEASEHGTLTASNVLVSI